MTTDVGALPGGLVVTEPGALVVAVRGSVVLAALTVGLTEGLVVEDVVVSAVLGGPGIVEVDGEVPVGGTVVVVVVVFGVVDVVVVVDVVEVDVGVGVVVGGNATSVVDGRGPVVEVVEVVDELVVLVEVGRVRPGGGGETGAMGRPAGVAGVGGRTVIEDWTVIVVEVELLLGAVWSDKVLVLPIGTGVGTLTSVLSPVPPVRTTKAITPASVATTPVATASMELRWVHHGRGGGSYCSSHSYHCSSGGVPSSVPRPPTDGAALSMGASPSVAASRSTVRSHSSSSASGGYGNPVGGGSGRPHGDGYSSGVSTTTPPSPWWAGRAGGQRAGAGAWARHGGAPRRGDRSERRDPVARSRRAATERPPFGGGDRDR